MLNEKKAVGYFPGMYLVYNYDDKKQGDEDDAVVQKRKQASFDAARKKVQDVLEKQLGVNVREEDEIPSGLISGETFAQAELADGQTEADRRRDARLLQLKLVAAELMSKPPDDPDVEKKYGIIEKIFKSYSKVPGLNTLMFRAFKQVEPEDFEIIGSIESFVELQGKKAKTSFQKAIYDIAGGKQPAVGKGEILSALFIGGTQGDDAAGTGLSFDVKSPTGETLNNKEITKAAQGATDISKFAIQFQALLKEKCGPEGEGPWPEFMELCKYLGLSDNLTETTKFIKRKKKEVTTIKAKVPNIGIEKIEQVLKLESQPWSGWDATQQENAVKAISWLCHVATTHELMIKASGSIAKSKKDYVVLQKNYKYEEVINLKKNNISLPVSGVSTNRVTYKQGGLYNKWPGNEFKFKKNGGAPVQSQATESKIYKLSLLEAMDLK